MSANPLDEMRQPGMPKKRVYRDVSQKYCSQLDDNVIVVREGNQFQCLSANRCGNASAQTHTGLISNCPKNL